MLKTSKVCKLFDIDRNYLMRLKEKKLLQPSKIESSGLKTALYDETAVERLWMIILLHKELGYKLDEVEKILENWDSNKEIILEEQIKELKNKVDHLNNVITVAESMKVSGLVPKDYMDVNSRSVKTVIDELAQKINNFPKRKSNNVQKVFGDKAFNDSFAKIVSFKKLGIESAKADVNAEIKILEDIFINHLGKGGPSGLNVFGDMLLANGEIANVFDEVMGEGVSKYVGEAIIKYYKKEKKHEKGTNNKE